MLDFFKQPGSAKQLIAQVMLILLITLIDLNLFFIKFLLQIPTSHWIMLSRTLLFAGISAPATQQIFQFATPGETRAMSEEDVFVLPAARVEAVPPTTLLLGLGILAVEVVGIIKHGSGVFTESAPLWVKVSWTLATAALLGELGRRFL